MTNLIRTVREELQLTGSELAARLGVTPGAVSQLERSERDGDISLNSLTRALKVMGRAPVVTTVVEHPMAGYAPERVTQSVNRALDEGDETYALRLITHSAQMVREHGELLSAEEASTRPSRIHDRRWEALFLAVYGAEFPEESWARPVALPRRWYVSRFAPLRERARTTTPERLRALNIYIDARSLERA